MMFMGQSFVDQLYAKRITELKQERNRFAYIALVVTCLLIMDVMLR